MIDDIITPLGRLFADGAQTVIRGHENRSRRVTLLKGNLVNNVRAESRGVSARVTVGGRHGFSSVAAYTPQDAETALKAATENAQFLSKRSSAERGGYPALAKGEIPACRAIVDTPQKRLIEACQAIDAYVEGKYPSLLSRTVVYTEDSQDKIILSSDAAGGHVTYPRCYIYVMMTAESQSGAPVELFKAFGGAGSFEDNFADVTTLFPGVDKLYSSVMDKANGVYAEAGNKTVILGGMMGGMLAHEAVGHTVEADLVMGGSVAGPNLNKAVASPLVTLTDFAHTAFGKKTPLPVYLDDEGVIATDAPLIENGILTG